MLNTELLDALRDKQSLSSSFIEMINSKLIRLIQSHDFETKKIDLVREMIIQCFLFPINLISPVAAELVENTINRAEELGLDLDKIQIGPLTQMTKLQLSALTKMQAFEILPYTLSQQLHYLFEKEHDDDTILETSTTFKFEELINTYSTHLIEVFNEKDPEKRINKLSNAMSVLQNFDLSAANTDIGNFLKYVKYERMDQFIKDNTTNLSEEDITSLHTFFRDPNLSALICNFISAFIAREMFIIAVEQNPGLEELANFGLGSYDRRSESVLRINKDPSEEIEIAFADGIDSILTNVTFSADLLFKASVDPKQKAFMEKEQTKLIQVIKESSMLIRALNDAGPTLEDPEGCINIINQLRKDFEVEDLTPREFFAKLPELLEQENATSSTTDIRLHILWRFIKDSLENEYNTIMNSGLLKGMNVEMQWGYFFYNLRYVAIKFKETKEQVFKNYRELIESGITSVQKIREFVIYNYVLYAVYGKDYDSKAKQNESVTPENVVQGALTIYPIFDCIFDVFEEILTESREKIDLNKAVVILLNRAVDYARKHNPDGHVVKIEAHPMLLSMLGFSLGERFKNVRNIFITYTQEGIETVMGNTGVFDKGGSVGTMGTVMSGGKAGSQEIVTASTPDRNKLVEPIKEFFEPEYIKKQAVHLNEMLDELIGDKEQITFTTFEIKKIMFKLIGILIGDYFPDEKTLERHLHMFEDLISETAPYLMEAMALKNQDEIIVNTDNAKNTSRKFGELFGELMGVLVKNNESEEPKNILSSIMQHELYKDKKGNIVATMMGLFEAGSKTLTQTIIQVLIAVSDQPGIWEDLGNANNASFTDVIEEALRVFPPVHVSLRNVLKDNDILMGVQMEEGDALFIDIAACMQDPKYYSEPEKFILGRADPMNRRTMPWLSPMQGFERGCIGYRYSLVIAIAFLRYLRERFNKVTLLKLEESKVDATGQQMAEVLLERVGN